MCAACTVNGQLAIITENSLYYQVAAAVTIARNTSTVTGDGHGGVCQMYNCKFITYAMRFSLIVVHGNRERKCHSSGSWSTITGVIPEHY